MADHDDITETLAPKSEQLDNIELTPEGRIFTVERVTVKKGTEQPVSVFFTDFPRPWKPGVNQRRVLGHCWGKKSSQWVGRRVHLYRDASVSYGKDQTGGTRIRALSHIDGPMDAPVLLSQGRSSTYRVEPLTDAPAITAPVEPTPQQVSSCTDVTVLTGWLEHSRPQVQAAIRRRIAELQPDGGPMVTAPTATGDEPWPQSGESLLDQSTT